VLFAFLLVWKCNLTFFTFQDKKIPLHQSKRFHVSFTKSNSLSPSCKRKIKHKKSNVPEPSNTNGHTRYTLHAHKGSDRRLYHSTGRQDGSLDHSASREKGVCAVCATQGRGDGGKICCNQMQPTIPFWSRNMSRKPGSFDSSIHSRICRR
jgi:hypothetical protein